MSDKKIFNLGGNAGFIFDSESCADINQANILFMGGDGNVSPELFDLAPKDGYGNNVEKDVDYVHCFNKALRKPNIKMIICVNYGAIIASAMAGCSLILETTNHKIQGLHKINGKKGEYLVPSNHTQMIYPYNLKNSDYEIIMRSSIKSDVYIGTEIPLTETDSFEEPEYILFKNFNKPVLAIMPDISKMRLNTRTVRMTNDLINKYFQK